MSVFPLPNDLSDLHNVIIEFAVGVNDVPWIGLMSFLNNT
jgi:hypothetical protein